MKPEQRQQQILTQLHALQSELGVEELSERFGVSALTIRRDLDQLEKDKAILRTHGGCVLKTAMGASYQQRVALNFELKDAIGRAAASEVTSNDVILLDYGSTPFHLAFHLKDVGSLLVYTNSISVVPVLSRFPSVRLFLLGGEYYSDIQFIGGSMMEQTLEGLQFDKIFLGTDAIDDKGNCLVANPDIGRLTEVMLRRGKRRILLADHTKLNGNGHCVYARLSDFDIWYTTAGINTSQLRRFSQQTTVKIAEVLTPTEE
jgi:DeoR/GlpR family transcriptional regulator of sugar metabolism